MVTDTQKVETRALSDDQLDAVSGGSLPLPLCAYTRAAAGEEGEAAKALNDFNALVSKITS
jgi:hypothetical protein